MKSQEIIRRIAEFPRFPESERFSRVRQVLSEMGHPELNIKFVHVTGTNGKGSTCAMMASVLQKAGYKVGLFSSPHLFDWRERIQINGVKISEEGVECHGTRVLDFEVGIFEAWFLMALSYFSAEKVDIAILEVGIGGRLDATNVIPSPEVSVLTNVDLEHTEVLGLTKEAIALEKAAIVKDSILVTGIQEPELLALLPPHRALVVEGTFWEQNRAVAREALRVLKERGWKLTDEVIESGLEQARWPLRMEELRQSPRVVADVGHNVHGVKAAKAMMPPKGSGRRTLWMGVSKDKEYETMARILSEGMDVIVLSEAHYHAVPAEELADFVVNEVVIPDLHEAARWLMEHLKKEDELFIMGGLYFATDAVQVLKEEGFL